MRLHRAAALPAAALLAAALTATPAAHATTPTTASAVVVAGKVLKFGQSARIVGEKGRPLRVAPIGVYYYRPPADASTKPKQRWFVAVAIRVTALSGADRMPPPITGNWWQVKSGGRAFTTSSGNAVITPWVGRVNEGVTAVKPGRPAVVFKSFDLPRAGGTLEWVTRDGSAIRWRIPTKNTGKAAYRPVVDAIADFNSGN